MRVYAPRTLISLLCLLCLPALAQEKITVVRIGVPLLNLPPQDVSATEARDHLVKAFNLHKFEKNLKISLQAVALDTLPGAQAIAEGKEKNCQFVLYTRVQALQRSMKSGADASGSFRNEADTALMEYELRRVTDGSPYSIGTARGDESDSGAEAILGAITWIPNKVMADLIIGVNPHFGADEAGTVAQPAASPNEDTFAKTDSCAWLPKDIPHADALRGACEYAVTQPEKLTSFMCQEETSRYQGHRRVPTDLITATIRYVDGDETYSNIRRNGRPVSGAMWNAAGLWSSGQFAGNLRAIFYPGNRAIFAFAGDNTVGGRAAWVFTYRIARQYEPEWELRADDRIAAPPYEGDLWVEKKAGSVQRFRSTATELPAWFAIRQAEILTDYGNVAFPDGTAFVLPVKSTVATRYRQEELTRNVVEFRGCRKFRATTRIVLDVPQAVPDGEPSIGFTPAELAAELDENEAIYSIAREEAITEDATRLDLEQQQDLKAATGEAFWRLAQLEMRREKLLAASAKNERHDSKYELVADVNGNSTFKVFVKLVPVTIVARDNMGRAVGNLKQEDFQLLDNRKTQEISSFLVEQSPGVQVSESASPGTVATRATLNNVAFVFDDLHTGSDDLTKAKAAAERHLSRFAPQDRAAVFTTSGDVVLDFTGDHDKLQTALHRLKSHSSASSADCPAMSYFTADLIANQGNADALQSAMEDALLCTGETSLLPQAQIQKELEKTRRVVLAKAGEVAMRGKMESDRTLGMLFEVLRRTVGVPGRRSIVLLSTGFLAPARNQQQGVMLLIQRALQSDVIISALEVHGLSGTSVAGDRSFVNEPTETLLLGGQDEFARGDVMAELASGTGGTFFHNNNDLEKGLRLAADVPEYIYVLGFSPQKLDGKFHKLKVTVKGPEKLTVQARQGYYALKPAFGP